MPIFNYICDCGTRLNSKFTKTSDPPVRCPDCDQLMDKEFPSEVSIAINEPHRLSKDRLSRHSQNKRK